MCGIVGLVAVGDLDKKQEKLRQEVMIFLGTELLLLTQPRGKEATGVTALFGNNDYMGLKMGVPAVDFITRFGGKKEHFDGFMEIWRNKKNPCKIFLGHCRQPTTGGGAPPEDNENNHPIKIGDTVGVHNGTLKNDDIIFKNLGCKRDGKVDSEAIFRLADHVIEKGQQPWTIEALESISNRLEGTFAVMAFNSNNPYQFVGMRDGRPLELAYLKPFKLMVLASEKDFIKNALFRYNKAAAITNFGVKNMPVLFKDDIIWRMMPDRTNFLMDLRQEPEEKNLTVADFFQESTIPFESKREWQTPVKSTFNNRNTGGTGNVGGTGGTGMTGGRGGSAGGVKKASVNATSVDSHSADKDKNKDKENRSMGFIWDSNSKTYEPCSAGTKITESFTEGLKNVEIDVETGKISNITGEDIIAPSKQKEGSQTVLSEKVKKSTREAKESSPTPNFELVESGGARIERLPQKRTAKIVVAETKRGPALKNENKSLIPYNPVEDEEATSHMKSIMAEKGPESKEVEVKETDPEALELAQKFANDRLRFESEEELASALDIKDVRSLQHIQIHHIANRMLKFFSCEAFYEGFMAAKRGSNDEKSHANSLLSQKLENLKKDKKVLVKFGNELQNKRIGAENRIRPLKAIALFLAKFMEKEVFNPSYDSDVLAFKDSIKEYFLNGAEIDSEKLKKVFSKGDLKTSSILSWLIESVEEAEEKERETFGGTTNV